VTLLPLTIRVPSGLFLPVLSLKAKRDYWFVFKKDSRVATSNERPRRELFIYEVTIHTQPHLNCLGFRPFRSPPIQNALGWFPCVQVSHTGVRIELTSYL